MRQAHCVTHRRPSQGGDSWEQYVGPLTGVPALLRALGADPAPILASAGLTFDSLAAPGNRIDFAAFGRLLANGAKATAHPLFGLTVGRLYRTETLGPLGEAMRNCATLGEALQLLTAHQQVNSVGGIAFMLQRGVVVDLGHAVHCPGTQGIDQIADACLAAGFNVVRELVGQSWRPTEVFLPHSRPASSVAYRQFFGTEPRFNADLCAMRFPAYWLDRPIAGASAERKRLALGRLQAFRPSVVMQSHRGLRTLLLNGKCSGDDLAQLLDLHRRTLNRRLREAGTTFRAVLDDVRFEIARQLLLYTNLCMDDVAASLGYAGPAPFMRSFRRWSGTTPGDWRRRVCEAERAADARRASARHAARDPVRSWQAAQARAVA